MSARVYVNGRYQPKEKAVVSVFDHGYLYGDGVFEGIRAYGGVVFRLREHLERLWASAQAIKIKIPLTPAALERAIHRTLAVTRLRDAYIRVVVSRGAGALGLDPRKCPKPTVVIIADKIVLYPEKFYRQGLEIVTASTLRNSPAALPPRIKSCNYLNNILAKIEGLAAGCSEVLMLNAAGQVAECSGDNIFAVRDGKVGTPPESAGILKGITREVAIELLAAAGVPFAEEELALDDLYAADEVFLTGTAAEIIGVTRIDGRVIGSGRPGPVTDELRRRFQQLVNGAAKKKPPAERRRGRRKKKK